ncbi:MAG: hypothetical protein LUG65_02655 [Clostridiales bacterium]|nr:hypothetical protein [Clostridiales bacterium]
MNDKKMQRLLKSAYAAPPPQRKETFLREHRRSEIGYGKLLTIQARYLPPSAWALSVALFALILLLSFRLDWRRVWVASALTPLLAPVAVTVSGQSERWGMAEWELSSRFSLQSVLLARLLALGGFHLALLAVLSPVLARCCSLGLLRAGVYLLAPYLASGAVGLALSRRLDGEEALYASVLTAVGLCLLFGLPGALVPAAYQVERFPLWVALLAALTAALLHEIRCSVKKTGGLYEAHG